MLLCDEATSALDPNTTRSILALLQDINRDLGVTIIVITHEMKVVEQICNRVAVMENGVVVETGNVKEVFLAPKSKVARELILPKTETVESMISDNIIRLAFDGRDAFEPLISNLVMECHAPVNILGADTKYRRKILRPDDFAAAERRSFRQTRQAVFNRTQCRF